MCCLFGFMDYGNSLRPRQRVQLAHILASVCEARGTDATGIAYNSSRGLQIHKRAVAGHKLRIRLPLQTTTVMGHTRLTTQGSEIQNQNNHPFLGNTPAGRFALAHNGVLHNDKFLREQQNLPHTPIETDSFIAVQLIEQENALHLKSLQTMAEQVEGSFVFTVLDEEDSLYFVRGENPLTIYHFPKRGLYVYASTKDLLNKSLTQFGHLGEYPQEVTQQCGDLVKITADGKIHRATFDDTHLYQVSYYPQYRSCYFPAVTDRTYLEELKSVAASFGYTEEEIDELYLMGITPDEIEEYLYCGMEV